MPPKVEIEINEIKNELTALRQLMEKIALENNGREQ
jgi:hypothetical protein